MRYFFCLMLGLGISALSGQNSYQFKAGVSLPVGDYGASEGLSAGFARQGFSIQGISKFALANDRFALGLHFSYQRHYYDEAALMSEVEELIDPVNSAEIYSLGFNPVLLGFGLSYQIPLFYQLSVGLSAYPGILFTNSGPIHVIIKNPQDITVLNEIIDFSDPLSFGYSLGLDFKYGLNKKFDLILFADYQSARHQYERFLRTLPGFSEKGVLNLTYLNLGLGFEMRL